MGIVSIRAACSGGVLFLINIVMTAALPFGVMLFLSPGGFSWGFLRFSGQSSRPSATSIHRRRWTGARRLIRPGTHTVGERIAIMHPDSYRDGPNLLTVEETATALHVSKKAVYNLLHSGKLKSVRRGRHFRIRKTDLLARQGSTTVPSIASKFDIELPQSIINSLARHLLFEIRKYYDSEEGQTAFEEWLNLQKAN